MMMWATGSLSISTRTPKVWVEIIVVWCFRNTRNVSLAVGIDGHLSAEEISKLYVVIIFKQAAIVLSPYTPAFKPDGCFISCNVQVHPFVILLINELV